MMYVKGYRVQMRWDPRDKVFLVNVPTLGAYTYGKTRQDAQRYAEEVISLQIKGLEDLGQPVPSPDKPASRVSGATAGLRTS